MWKQLTLLLPLLAQTASAIPTEGTRDCSYIPNPDIPHPERPELMKWPKVYNEKTGEYEELEVSVPHPERPVNHKQPKKFNEETGEWEQYEVPFPDAGPDITEKAEGAAPDNSHPWVSEAPSFPVTDAGFAIDYLMPPNDKAPVNEKIPINEEFHGSNKQPTSISDKDANVHNPVELPVPTENNRTISHRNIVYFTNWGVYGQNYHAQDLPADQVTHLVYAFADIKPDGEVVSSDTYSDVEKIYNSDTQEGEDNAYGSINQLYMLKKKNRHLKTLLSIGGWTYSQEGKFEPAAKSEQSRRRFADSAVQLVSDWGMDGIDIDWEYPNTAEDAHNFVLLLKTCREALDEYAAKHDQDYHYLLTIAASANPAKFNTMEIEDMDKYIDTWHIMAYDFTGSWEPVTGHQSNLFPDKAATTQYSAEAAVQGYLDRGVFADKLVLGLPLYGRGFTGTSGMGASYKGMVKGPSEEGIYPYHDLPRPGAQVRFDATTGATFSYDPSTQELVTYDDEQSTMAKADYIVEMRLGGALFWEAAGDKKGKESLIRLMADEMGAQDESKNMLDYPASRYKNIRKGV